MWPSLGYLVDRELESSLQCIFPRTWPPSLTTNWWKRCSVRTAADRWPRVASGSSGSVSEAKPRVQCVHCMGRLPHVCQGAQSSSSKGPAPGLRLRHLRLRLAVTCDLVLRRAGMRTRDGAEEPSCWLSKPGLAGIGQTPPLGTALAGSVCCKGRALRKMKDGRQANL